MAWSDVSTILAATSVADSSDSITWSSDQTLSPGEQAHVQIKVERGGTTDDADIYVRSYLDTDDDTIPIYSYTHETGDDATSYSSIVLSGIYGFAVGARGAGDTDTHTVTISLRKDGVDL